MSTWERFCSEVLGYDAGYFVAIRKGIEILAAKGVQSPTVAQATPRGRRPRSRRWGREDGHGRMWKNLEFQVLLVMTTGPRVTTKLAFDEIPLTRGSIPPSVSERPISSPASGKAA